MNSTPCFDVIVSIDTYILIPYISHHKISFFCWCISVMKYVKVILFKDFISFYLFFQFRGYIILPFLSSLSSFKLSHIVLIFRLCVHLSILGDYIYMHVTTEPEGRSGSPRSEALSYPELGRGCQEPNSGFCEP